MNPGSIQKDDLAVRSGLDPCDPIARGLRPRGDNGDFLPQELIQKG
jgi:hypothetical protein